MAAKRYARFNQTLNLKLKTLKFIIFSVVIVFCACEKNYTLLNDDIPQKIVNDSALFYFDEGDRYLIASKFDTAFVLLSKSLEFEKNTLIYNQLGIVEINRKRYDEAMKYHKLGTEADSTYYTNYLNLAKIYLSKGDYQNAENNAKKVIQINSSEYSAAMGNLYMAMLSLNQKKDCSIVNGYIEKAKILKYDFKLSAFYNKIKHKADIACHT